MKTTYFLKRLFAYLVLPIAIAGSGYAQTFEWTGPGEREEYDVSYTANGGAPALRVSGADAVYTGHHVTLSALSSANTGRVAEVLNGGTLRLIDSEITTDRDSTAGIYMESGSSGTLTNTVIRAEGIGSFGIMVVTNSNIDVIGGMLRTVGDYSYGIAMDTGATGTLTDVEIVTEGIHSYGILAKDSDTGIDVIGGTITTVGDYSYGIAAGSGVTAILSDVMITTSGDYAHGIYAAGSDSNINIVGGTIATSGEASFGAFLEIGATGMLTNTVIRTEGSQAMGIYATGSDTHINVVGGTITMTGESAQGVIIGAEATGTLRDVEITTSGDYSHGIFMGASHIDVIGGTITTSGEGSVAILMNEESSGTLHGVTVVGSKIGSITIAVALADNASLNVMGRSVINGNVFGAGYGNILHLTDSVLNGEILTLGDISPDGSLSTLTIDGNSVWNMTADSFVTTLMLDGTSSILFTQDSGDFTSITAASAMLASGTFLLLDLDGSSVKAGDEFQLFITENLVNSGTQLMSADQLWVYEYVSTTDGLFTITGVAPIPEPTTATLGLLGLGVLALRRRKAK